MPVLGMKGKQILSTGGKHYIDFCQTNYLSFEFDPLLNDRGYAWTKEWGSMPGWARMEADCALYERFETRLAALLGAPRVLTLPTITISNFSLIPGIVQRGLILTDKKLHTVVWEACRLARDHGATVRSFRHQDVADLERLLKEYSHLTPKLIAVDGVYSISTELAPIRELQELCERYDAFLYVDDAHGFGSLGKGADRGESVRSLWQRLRRPCWRQLQPHFLRRQLRKIVLRLYRLCHHSGSLCGHSSLLCALLFVL